MSAKYKMQNTFQILIQELCQVQRFREKCNSNLGSRNALSNGVSNVAEMWKNFEGEQIQARLAWEWLGKASLGIPLFCEWGIQRKVRWNSQKRSFYSNKRWSSKVPSVKGVGKLCAIMTKHSWETRQFFVGWPRAEHVGNTVLLSGLITSPAHPWKEGSRNWSPWLWSFNPRCGSLGLWKVLYRAGARGLWWGHGKSYFIVNIHWLNGHCS